MASLFLVLTTICWVVESAEFFGAFSDNKILSPPFTQIARPQLTKVECSLLCSQTTNCDAYNFIPPQSGEIDVTCQVIKIGFNTTAVAGPQGAEVWISRTSSSGFIRSTLLPDWKVYTVINQSAQPFSMAETQCSQIGARVAGPTSIEKFEAFVASMVGLNFGYMGMQDTAIQGLFVDNKGNSYPWSLNYPDEPGAQGPQEDCLLAWDTVPNGLTGWMIGDNLCNTTGPYICEFPRPQSWKDIGCFETPPKPEGAVYEHWDGVSLPIPVGATVSSICKSGQHFHTGIPVYTTTCDADGYWIRPNPPMPFCTGTPGYLSNGTNCFKLLQEAIVFPISAQARCQQLGGSVLTFTATTRPIFKALIFPQGSTAPNAKAIAGYSDAAVEGSWKDAQGNVMPSEVWDNYEPKGGSEKNYAYVWYSDPSVSGVVYADGNDTYQSKGQLICIFSNC